MQIALVAAVVATVTMRLTPAAAARSSTAGRSCWKRSSSKWACVSISSRVTLAQGRFRIGKSQSFKSRQMLPFQVQDLLDFLPAFRVRKACVIVLQIRDGAALRIHQQRQQVIER